MRCNHRGCWALYPKAWDQDKGFFPYTARSFEALRRRKACQICALKGSLAAGGGVVGAEGRVSTRPQDEAAGVVRMDMWPGQNIQPQMLFQKDHTMFL